MQPQDTSGLFYHLELMPKRVGTWSSSWHLREAGAVSVPAAGRGSSWCTSGPSSCV